MASKAAASGVAAAAATAAAATARRKGRLNGPSGLVVVFHGLGGNSSSLDAPVEQWAKDNPNMMYVLAQGFDASARGGYDWFRYGFKREDVSSDEEYTRMVVETVSASLDRVDAMIDVLQKEANVDDTRTILAGFSQGAAISCYAGLRRRVAGVIPMGGPCPPREALLPLPPSGGEAATEICAITGDADRFAPHEEIKRLLGRYPGAQVHIIEGQKHEVSKKTIDIASRFFSTVSKEWEVRP